ncbi:MAG: MATE family efflux transporter [Spirochaetales bacterium]
MIRLVREMLADKPFFTTLFAIGWPIAVQHGFITALNMLDILMVGQLGEVEIGAVAIGNQVFFLVMLFLFGVGSGSAVFVAQYWGRGDVPGIRRSYGLAMFVAIPGSVLAAAFVVIYPDIVLRFFTSDESVIALGVDYVRVASPSYLFMAITVVTGAALRGTGEVRLPLRMTIIALAINAVLNYVFIFGPWGLPALGVVGAALGTSIARGLEAVLLIGGMRRKAHPMVGRFRDYTNVDRVFASRFVTVTMPVVVNEIVWSMGVTMYTVIYARMGTPELAASNIAETVIRMTFVVFMGSGGAAAVMIGNTIGEGDIPRAERDARRFMLLAPVGGIFMGLVLALISPLVPLMYQITPDVRSMVTRMLLVVAIVVPVKSFNLHAIVGILRGGGDTRFALYSEAAMLWGIGVPVAAFVGLVIGAPIYLVLLSAQGEEVGKTVLTFKRLLSYRWIHQVTEGTGVSSCEAGIEHVT